MALTEYEGKMNTKAKLEEGLFDQLMSISGRLYSLGAELDKIGDRISGPIPTAVGDSAGSPQPPHLAAVIRSIKDHLSRAESEAQRISGAL
jgi:hypothetical protein